MALHGGQMRLYCEVILLFRTVLRYSSDASGCCSCRFLYLRSGEVCGVWRAFVEGGVRPLRVVKADPVVDDPFDLKAVGDLVQIHSLLLQGPPEPLGEDIVQIPSSAVH